MPKKRSPDDVHDIFNVKVGKPYRGSIVEKIDIETTDLPSGKVKVRRLIHMDDGIILIEDTWHEPGEVFDGAGNLLPYDQINFPSMNPDDFKAPVRKKDKDDEEEKQRKRDILRQKAKEMLNKNNAAPDDKSESDSDDDNDDDDDDDEPEIQVEVHTPDGEIFSVVVRPDDTVNDLKDKIENEHYIPMNENALSLDGKPLDKPNNTMEDYGIKDGDIVNLEPKDDPFIVKVRTPDGKKHNAHVRPSNTVRDLMEIIEDDHGIPIKDQTLLYRGDPLDDPASTMADNGISNGDVIDLTTNDITVNIRTPDGKTFPITTKPDRTVKDIKKAISKRNGMPVKDQKLEFEGKQLKDPSETMDDIGVSDGDVIDLTMNDITVNIRTTDGKTFPIVTKPDGTVKDIKKEIAKVNGTPVKDQKLDFEGKRLKDPSATMNDIGVSDGDTLELRPTNRDASDKGSPRKPTPKKPSGSTPKAKERKRLLNPNSAWVYPSSASAPRKGEENNLQGVWSTPPAKGSGTEPVEVNIHPKNKEPKSDGKNDIHGAYGYINGAVPDENGVVDPVNVVFYPPGVKDYSPDFEHIGWWSAPESSSKTTVSWRFEGMDCLNVKKHTVNVMGHELTFVKEWVE